MPPRQRKPTTGSSSSKAGPPSPQRQPQAAPAAAPTSPKAGDVDAYVQQLEHVLNPLREVLGQAPSPDVVDWIDMLVNEAHSVVEHLQEQAEVCLANNQFDKLETISMAASEFTHLQEVANDWKRRALEGAAGGDAHDSHGGPSSPSRPAPRSDSRQSKPESSRSLGQPRGSQPADAPPLPPTRTISGEDVRGGGSRGGASPSRQQAAPSGAGVGDWPPSPGASRHTGDFQSPHGGTGGWPPTVAGGGTPVGSPVDRPSPSGGPGNKKVKIGEWIQEQQRQKDTDKQKEARQTLKAALDSDTQDAGVLEFAITEAKGAGLAPGFIAQGERALRELQTRQRTQAASQRLQELVGSGVDAATLKQALSQAKEAGLQPSQLMQAERALQQKEAEEHQDLAAQETRRHCVDELAIAAQGVDPDALMRALAEARRAGVADKTLKKAESQLKALRFAQRYIGPMQSPALHAWQTFAKLVKELKASVDESMVRGAGSDTLKSQAEELWETRIPFPFGSVRGQEDNEFAQRVVKAIKGRQEAHEQASAALASRSLPELQKAVQLVTDAGGPSDDLPPLQTAIKQAGEVDSMLQKLDAKLPTLIDNFYVDLQHQEHKTEQNRQRDDAMKRFEQAKSEKDKQLSLSQRSHSGQAPRSLSFGQSEERGPLGTRAAALAIQSQGPVKKADVVPDTKVPKALGPGEENCLAVGFELQLDGYAMEHFDRKLKNELEAELMQKMKCDSVQVVNCRSEAEGAVVEVHAVGFPSEERRNEAVEKLTHGTIALSAMVWGKTALTKKPELMTKPCKPSPWLKKEQAAAQAAASPANGSGIASTTAEDAPGTYIITHPDTGVLARVDASNEVIATIAKGSKVEILEVVKLPALQRIRGRLADPAGWISLMDTSDGYRWAVADRPAKSGGTSSSAGHDNALRPPPPPAPGRSLSSTAPPPAPPPKVPAAPQRGERDVPIGFLSEAVLANSKPSREQERDWRETYASIRSNVDRVKQWYADEEDRLAHGAMPKDPKDPLQRRDFYGTGAYDQQLAHALRLRQQSGAISSGGACGSRQRTASPIETSAGLRHMRPDVRGELPPTAADPFATAYRWPLQGSPAAAAAAAAGRWPSPPPQQELPRWPSPFASPPRSGIYGEPGYGEPGYGNPFISPRLSAPPPAPWQQLPPPRNDSPPLYRYGGCGGFGNYMPPDLMPATYGGLGSAYSRQPWNAPGYGMPFQPPGMPYSEPVLKAGYATPPTNPFAVASTGALGRQRYEDPNFWR
eukprot:TRINITY_DN16709_c0_g1_i1.p1 TRINITY_DN16709_c0_g1~~TRINITY_DN16709_c0_g1_i1.p1  ORF type:complete len:1261 (+),score=294.99 TRINITY_DN16709_c0_g1_i1:96-3878(+)